MLICGHKSHTGSFSLDKCYEAQAELERRAAAYDALAQSVQSIAEWREHLREEFGKEPK